MRPKDALFFILLTLIGCSGNVRYEDQGISLNVNKNQGKQTNIRIEQKIKLEAYRKENIYHIVEYTYFPCSINFVDFENIKELPRPLPFSLLRDNEQASSEKYKNFIISNYNQEVPLEEEDLLDGIPFEIEGKNRVSKETLDFLIAADKVEPLEEYSLGTIVVNYDVRQSVKVDVIKYSETSRGFNDEGKFLFFPESGIYDKFERQYDEFIIFQPVIKRFDDKTIKNITDEIIWQLSTIEGIEGLFEKIRKYEGTHSVPITHFAVHLDKDYGIGESFTSDSKAKGGFFSANASSSAESDQRYGIHLSGIIATEK